ncbi:MAG TPA: DUF475 domain-containing protein [Candidatus Pristimantibacillus sp.]|jgi:hypothetical protein|nr:DUF475 domain-containing protein [Candidatus Pristimantibacillus sp.]
MHKALHPHSPWRIFAVSGLVTIASIVGVLLGYGAKAMLLALILIAVELAFSFDNAIVNAKVLKNMSSFWQVMFLTIGAAIAIFGMRLVFPILLVAVTADLSWQKVIDLALHHPEEYADKLHQSHVQLSAFAGSFLLMLALHFFIDDRREVLWLDWIEKGFRKLAFDWVPAVLTTCLVVGAALLPFNEEPKHTLVAGLIGVVTYGIIHFVGSRFGQMEDRRANAAKQVGLAGLVSFLYLQVLDITFSFDGVLGAFAVTGDVVLIAIGLGVGAMWVRSLTVFMVRRGTLDKLLYIEHGAYYAIGILACLMLLSIFVNVPDLIAGLTGVGVITASLIASRQAIASGHGTAAKVK